MVATKKIEIGPEFSIIQQQLRINLKQYPPLDFLQELVQQHHPQPLERLQELLHRALELGESNSALVVGSRGVGKSSVVRVALSKFSDCPDVGGSWLTLNNTKNAADGVLIKLHGLVQTDDRLALQEITRQLQLEQSVATRQFGSFAENLSFLLTSLKKGERESSKCVVFVLEEFDLFCHHRNQTLLYNLFDIAQSAQTPVCVLGVTCRLDVVELLEKRVRSRFSHRQLHLQLPSLNQYITLTKQILTVVSLPGLSKRHAQDWNSSVDRLLENDAVEDELVQLYELSKDITTLKQLLLVIVSTSCGEITVAAVQSATRLLLADAVMPVLKGLSTLQLALVIAMMHLSVKHDGVGFTFELVFSEYIKFTRRRCSVQAFERPVVFKAFDQLRSLEVVTSYDSCSRGSGVQKEYQHLRLQWPAKLLQRVLHSVPNMPTDLLQWAASALAN